MTNDNARDRDGELDAESAVALADDEAAAGEISQDGEIGEREEGGSSDEAVTTWQPRRGPVARGIAWLLLSLIIGCVLMMIGLVIAQAVG